MRPFRILFLPLIFSLHLLSCSSTNELTLYKPADGTSIQKFSPLGNLSEPMLFKARIRLFKDQHSGLFLIKRMPGNASTHVVFLSELGLSLLDLEYREDEFEVVSVQEFLNKPALVRTFQKDFRTLLLDLSAIETYAVKRDIPESTEILEFKHKSQRYTYYHRESSGTYLVQRKKGLFEKVDYDISGEDKLKIGIAHNGDRLHMDLIQLKQTIDNDH
jgi:hypothetical protein